MSAETVAPIWAFLIATAVFLYVCMDGFDLGVGILFPFVPRAGRPRRRGELRRPGLGRQRDLAGPGRRGALRGVPAGLCDHLAGALHAADPDAAGADFPRRLLRDALPRRDAAAAAGRDRAFSWGSLCGAPSARAWRSAPSCRASGCEEPRLCRRLVGLADPVLLLTGAGAGGGLRRCSAPAGWSGRPRASCRPRPRGLARPLGCDDAGADRGWSALIMPFLQPAFRARWFAFPALLAAPPVPVLVVALGWRFSAALGETDGHAWSDGRPSCARWGCSSWPIPGSASACGR